MRCIRTAFLAAAVLPFAASYAAPRLTPEAELAKTLEGRTAGKPVNCISLNRVRSSRIIDDTAIVYDAGNTLYVNRPRGGAESLDRWDTLVTRLHSNQLCSIDVVHLYDSGSRMETGSVLLGEFVPYRRHPTSGF